MKHYGNVTKINGAEVEPVDAITFGSPCQDVSVAGKRAGIQDGERSNLFFEAVRIIKEMREATNGEYPKYAVWENVPGAFSSNKGHDFHAVLEALCSVCDSTVSIPRPSDPKRPDNLVWDKAGEIVGDNYSIAWRTLDAQYWGVPQRRKRIYLVADFTGRCAGEILFKPEGLRGYMSQGNEAGQGSSADAVGSVDGSSGNGGQLAATLTATYGTKWNGNAGSFNGENFVLQKHGADGSVGVGAFCAGAAPAAGSIGYSESVAPTLKAAQCAFPMPAIVYALQANGIDRADTAGCNGCGWRENESYTLNTVDRHAVCFDRAAFNQGINAQYDFEVSEEGVVSTVVARGPSGVCYDARGNGDGETACTITGDHQNRITDYTAVAVQQSKPPRRYIIRRLTPTECARLQGFPDKWGHLAPYNPADAEFWENVRKTHAEINGKKYKPVKDIKKWYEKLHTDSAEYKMWGNGIALPNAEYVLHGIAKQGAKTLGSLFDGSGGFPLAGAMNGIKPVWASEVEPYPIAVTKSRFAASAAERKEK